MLDMNFQCYIPSCCTFINKMKYYTWKIMVITLSIWRNLLINQKLTIACQEIATSRKLSAHISLLINVIFSSHTSLVFSLFPIIEVYIGRQSTTNFYKCFNYWIIFFKKFKQCVTESIMQGRSPFLGFRKMGFKNIHSKN